MDKKKLGIICALVVVVAFVIVGFATNWFKGAEQVANTAASAAGQAAQAVASAAGEAVQAVASAAGEAVQAAASAAGID